MRYFPYSTGTFWPLGIEALLREGELEEIKLTRGISYQDQTVPGQFIPDFPLRRSGPSYENFLQLIHMLRLDALLRKLRGEYVIGGQVRRLRRVPRYARSVSGNFPPLLDSEIFHELSIRFAESNIVNPFNVHKNEKSIIIHYRLGDMRKMPARNQQYGGHGVVDPAVFKEILQSLNLDLGKVRVGVVSDEPEIAIQLLKEAGVEHAYIAGLSDVWADLRVIASAGTFLASSSQFSIVGAVLCLSNGGRVVLPSSNYGEGSTRDHLDIVGFDYFGYRYLSPQHWIFNSQN